MIQIYPPSTATHNSDGEWEDVPDTNLARGAPPTMLSRRSGSVASSTSGTQRSGTRRRKLMIRVGRGSRPQSPAVPSPRPLVVPKQQIPKSRGEHRPVIDRADVEDALRLGAAEAVRYSGAVISHASRLLKWPFAILFACWLLAVLVARLAGTLRFFASPLCILPGISSSFVCRAPQVRYDTNGDAIPQWADYPKLVNIQTSNFEQLLDGSVGGSGLSLEIKKAEMASKDLITLVKYSQLKSKGLLAEALFDFVEDAKLTGQGLQKLTSKVNGAVDKIMAINDYALRAIDSAQTKPQSLALQILWPFASPAPRTQAAVVEAFRRSMDVHADEMRRLVLELEVSEANLDRLDTHLLMLHDLCTRENLALGADRDDLLAQLWTRLGGNRGRLRGMDYNLALLRDLGEYRKRAAAHVAAAKQTLLAMSEDMEDLRERVAAPEIVGDSIPIEVHMQSIQSGLERLKEDRIRARARENQLMNKILGVDV
ncbi:hypothetical protein BC628DRAFT_1308328 [Trametes gibbosa]|nr:hypothetical protein BC628DRAFT_1308328 [Trametes gibbosa]